MSDSKYQEALDEMHSLALPCHEEVYKHRRMYLRERYDLLQELIDKATPKKPIYKEEWFGSKRYFFCAHCGSRLPKSYNFIDQMTYPYCPYCGGKLDWSDKDEC